MKKKFNILLLLSVALCYFHTAVVGQVSPYQIPAKWYYGVRAGIDFTSGTPVFMSGNPAVNNQEGGTSVSDTSRKVAFYIPDAVNIYNGSNSLIGTLPGGTSSTQGGVSFPDPADPVNQFYLITTNCDGAGGSKAGGQNGINYVVYKKDGTIVSGPTNISSTTEAGEFITSSSDRDGGYWLISHKRAGTGYIVWHVTASGVGTKQTYTGTVVSSGWQGSLKINKCQDRIAFVNYAGGVEVYVWDAINGKLGSKIYSKAGSAFFYGCEFSPNGEKLYYSDFTVPALYQLDLSVPTFDITTLSTSSSNGFPRMGTMQLASNGKIYVANGSNFASPAFLGVINNPDGTGAACNYDPTGFTTPSPSTYVTGVANLGWTNPNKPVIKNTSAVACPNIYGFGYEFRTYFNQKIDVATSKWDFGDGSALVNNDNAPSHTYPSKNVDTTYLIKLELTDASCGYTWTDTMFVKVKACSQKVIPETPVCAGVTSAFVKITNVKANEVYQIVKPDGTIIDGPTTVTVDADTLEMLVSQANLTPGVINDFKVQVQRAGTSTFLDLDDADIEVKDKPKTDLLVFPNPQTLCTDTAIVKLFKAEPGAVYTVRIDKVAYPAITPVNDNDTLIFILPDLPAGTHDVSFNVTFAACLGTFLLDDSAKVTIVGKADTTLEVSSVSPLCLEPGTTATVKVKNAEKDFSYQVTYQGKPVSTAEVGAAADLNLTIPYDTLVKISNTPSTTPPLYVFNVTVTTLCQTKTLLDTAGIFLAVPAKQKTITVTPDPVCKEDTLYIKIAAADTAVTYTVLNESFKLRNPGDTVIKVLATTPLVAGLNTITVTGEVKGCPGVVTIGSATVILIELADTTLEVSSVSPLCLEPGTTATIKVKNAEKDLTYQVTYQGKPVSTAEVGAAADLNLTIPYDTLVKISNTPSTTPPLYVFNVTVTTLCKTKNLLDTAGIYLAAPAKTKVVTVLQDPVCKGDTIRIQIAQADTAVTYTVFVNTVLVETFKMSNPGDTIIKVLASTPFVAGSVNNIAVNGEVKGCPTPVVVGTATVKVNNPVDTTITYSIDSICVKHDAIIVFNNPQADVTYTAYLGNDPVSAGTGTSSIVLDKAYFNAIGKYGVLITGTPQAGCPVDTLHQRDTVKVVELDKAKLVSKDTIVVCANGDKAIVQIYDPQPAVTYSYGSSSVKAPSVATDSIQLVIPVSALADGLNDIRIDIANTICNDTLLAHAFILKINQVKGIIGDTSICRINKYEFEVSPLVPGAKSYTWWTKHNAVVSNPVKLGNADSARVTFDFAAVVQDTDVVYVSVNGDSICTFPPAELKVRMFDPLSGLILKDDTICADAYGPDSVRYTVTAPVSNAPKYKWVIKNGPDGLIIKYPLTEAGVPDSTGGISIAFPPVARTVDSIGIDLEIIPYSVCLKDYDAANSVIKHITILPTPDVNAGRDIDTVSATFPQIILDGTTTANGRPSSSLNPASGKPVYQYSWIPKETGSYIESPDKIKTLLVSQSAEQNTYVLSVWNRGMCMVSDEVNIKIQLTIDPSNAFTPNGDGKNDVWEIRNLEYFPNNTLVIYNQWGSKVYEASPYHNNWAGTHNGEDLPIGTYYYVLDVHKANIAPMAGSITIVK